MDPYKAEGREPGARRKKLAGYLKAANELRQTYQQSYTQQFGGRDMNLDTQDIPGAFPGAIITRNGEEQMVIFPSYARRHTKQKPQAVPGTIQQSAGSGRDIRDTTGSGDAEFWKQQWDQYEDDHAIVDVDIRGWVYSPHRGPLTRRHRLAVGLARQMVGLPGPSGKSPSSSPGSSRPSSPHGFREKMEARSTRHEEEIALREAESIVKRGESEAQAAGAGVYSEQPYADLSGSGPSSATPSRGNSPSGFQSSPRNQSKSGSSDDFDQNQISKRSSWSNLSQMSAAEQATANMHLMTRLKPFLANPRTNTPISAFFYNDEKSVQKTVDTNASGHFSFRAALDFVPTDVRILASENLSATEEVHVIEPHGVSVISDIDDTIKHSGISNGAKEIFKNVFIRDLRDLVVQGVAPWYERLANLDVRFHYVSNAPWQLYPLLTEFFSQAGLPAGSFHLRQYSGMFQGIFEPVAERKKTTLDKIFEDFPERRFILIGDSGEADLEVYTDYVLEHPGRVLGIFIRDVTTPQRKGFFDSAMGPLSDDAIAKRMSKTNLRENGTSNRARLEQDHDHDADLELAKARSLREYEQKGNSITADKAEDRPKLPPRRPIEPRVKEGNLIDLELDDEPSLPTHSQEGDHSKQQSAPSTKLQPPPRPAKPRSLSPTPSSSDTKHTPGSAKSPPPRPRKPSTSVNIDASPSATHVPLSTMKPQPESAMSSKPTRPDPPPPRQSYGSAAKQKLSTAYNALPSMSGQALGKTGPSLRGSTTNANANVASNGEGRTYEDAPPPVPPRKTASFPASMLHPLSSTNTNPTITGNSNSGLSADVASMTAAGAPLNKREELWKRRWARAKGILDSKGVALRAWRVGEDAEAEAVRLVERALREDQNTQGSGRRR